MQRFEHLLGSRAYGDVPGEVYPSNHAIRIKQKLGRACDVRSFRSRSGMQHIIPADDFGLGIRKQWESVT